MWDHTRHPGIGCCHVWMGLLVTFCGFSSLLVPAEQAGERQHCAAPEQRAEHNLCSHKLLGKSGGSAPQAGEMVIR